MHKLSKPQCRIIGIQQGQNFQDERAKEPGGRISQGTNERGGVQYKPRGERARCL